MFVTFSAGSVHSRFGNRLRVHFARLERVVLDYIRSGDKTKGLR